MPGMLLQQMSVDTSRVPYIRLNFNLSYPALPCQGVCSFRLSWLDIGFLVML